MSPSRPPRPPRSGEFPTRYVLLPSASYTPDWPIRSYVHRLEGEPIEFTLALSLSERAGLSLAGGPFVLTVPSLDRPVFACLAGRRARRPWFFYVLARDNRELFFPPDRVLSDLARLTDEAVLGRGELADEFIRATSGGSAVDAVSRGQAPAGGANGASLDPTAVSGHGAAVVPSLRFSRPPSPMVQEVGRTARPTASARVQDVLTPGPGADRGATPAAGGARVLGSGLFVVCGRRVGVGSCELLAGHIGGCAYRDPGVGWLVSVVEPPTEKVPEPGSAPRDGANGGGPDRGPAGGSDALAGDGGYLSDWLDGHRLAESYEELYRGGSVDAYDLIVLAERRVDGGRWSAGKALGFLRGVFADKVTVVRLG